jgi:hypothetical protein
MLLPGSPEHADLKAFYPAPLPSMVNLFPVFPIIKSFAGARLAIELQHVTNSPIFSLDK